MNIFGGQIFGGSFFFEIYESWSIFSGSALLICWAKQNKFLLKKYYFLLKKTFFTLHFETAKNEHDNADKS